MKSYIKIIIPFILTVIVVLLAPNISSCGYLNRNAMLLPPFKSVWELDIHDRIDSGMMGKSVYFANSEHCGVFNTVDRKLEWRMDFKGKHDFVSCAASESKLFITLDNKRLLALRLKDGKLLLDKEFRKEGILIPIKNLLLSGGSSSGIITAFNSSDLKPVWECDLNSAKSSKNSTVSSDDLYPYISNNSIIGINIKDGSIAYRIKTDDNPIRIVKSGNRLYISGRSADEKNPMAGKIRAINANTGKLLWEHEFKNISEISPAIIDELLLVNAPDKNSLTALNRHTGKITWSRKLRYHIGSSPHSQGNQIIFQMGSYICSLDKKGNDVFTYYPRDYDPSGQSINFIRDGFIVYESSAKCFVTGEDEPSPKEIAGLIDNVKKLDYTTDESIKRLAVSRDPAAIDFLVAQMKDPNTFISVKKIAYQSMAGSGMKASIDAILSVRDTSRTIIPLKQRLVFDHEPDVKVKYGINDIRRKVSILSMKEDSSGRMRGLMRMGIAGNPEDLWVSQLKDKKWQNFMFTGDSGSFDEDKWMEKYVVNASIEIDTDSDGLTDIIEARYGTSIDKADSDSDGLIDSIDKNPLTELRVLNETEKILGAAFEGYFNLLNNNSAPMIVIFPDSIKPFELFGLDGIILPQTYVKDKPIFKYIGHGTTTFSFIAPEYDIYGNFVEKGTNDFKVIFNDDHSEAVVGFMFYQGNLSAEGGDIKLRKIGGIWFVIDIKISWIS